jgi:hypothetical protein
LGAVQEGIGQLTWRDSFAYAEGRDEARGRYLGLKAGQSGSVVMDDQSLLVRPEAAQRQLDQEAVGVQRQVAPPESQRDVSPATPGTAEPPPVPLTEKKLRRFYGTVELDTLRLGRDAAAINDAVIQHLNSLVGAEVSATLEIHARLPDGAPDQVVRTVTENARTLKFKEYGFEEE